MLRVHSRVTWQGLCGTGWGTWASMSTKAARRRVVTADQAASLPILMQKTIPTNYLDENEHVNIRHYLGLVDDAAWSLFERVGMSRAYFLEKKGGVFDLEHHVHYVQEIRAGDEVAVRARVLARNAKRFHAVYLITNESRGGDVSCILEAVSSYADLHDRRTAPWPEQIAAKLDEIIAEDKEIPWEAPLCGAMGI